MSSQPKIRLKTKDEMREEFSQLDTNDLIRIQLVIGELIRLRTDPKIIYAHVYNEK